MHGDTANAWNIVIPGIYGTMGVAAPSNVPGARRAYARWQDQSNKFYLFGGVGYDANGTQGHLNDLWRYDPSINQWAWIGGSKFILESASMDSLCQEASDEPSGRMENRAAWRSGCYLVSFGGYNSQGDYNDLWAFNLNTKKWKWLSGDVLPSQAGHYGVKLVASIFNKPGSRTGSNGWKDVTGNFWLFGGGLNRNDMWKFTPDPLCLSCGDVSGFGAGHASVTELEFSPNPFSESATLSYSGRLNISELIIFDLFGNKVRRYSDLPPGKLTIKKEDLSEGIYYLSIHTLDAGVRNLKMVVQK
jgi:hypothetical protein